MIGQIGQVKGILERLYGKYNRHSLIKPDPLQFVYKYRCKADMEIAALLSAVLAYGRVQQIEKSLTDLFGRMGDSPFAYIQNFNVRQRERLRSFKHRFTTGDDISDLLELLQVVVDKYDGIEKFFVGGYSAGDETVITALSKFCDSLLQMHASRHKGNVPDGLKYLLTRPDNGSACKRLNLFLRWMIRDDDVDTGLWRLIDKAALIVPVDVHIARLSGILGFHNRRAVSLSTAVEITRAFAEIEPSDPVKYDFALSRIGILEKCNGRLQDMCLNCELYEFCSDKG